MACHPGPLPPYAPPEALCSCGATLHAVPSGPHDWCWKDEDDQAFVDSSPAEYIRNAHAWWSRLAAENIAAYSDLSARFALCGTPWLHHHAPLPGDPYRGPVPYCCGDPMHAVPVGWRCRVSGATFGVLVG